MTQEGICTREVVNAGPADCPALRGDFHFEGLHMDLDLAREMMVDAADLLKYKCPDDLPEITVEPELLCSGLIRWSWLQPPSIALRNWRGGNFGDQATLVHELVHWVQLSNGVEMKSNDFYKFDPTEIEAVTVECRWLQSRGENPRDHLSESAVHKMTGDKEFARL
ncbi:MAG TPA: hypothetical protein VHP34_11185, partial [Alphaproteobacteria bacterium]|nr:hypothetical protein [Alphaproteobacteria bacterium]